MITRLCRIMTGRDLFLICNNFEVLGGVQTWVHYMARLFGSRGHRVHVIGVTHPKRARHHVGDFPYPTTVLHKRFPDGDWRLRGLDRLKRGPRRLRAERLRGSERLADLLSTAGPDSVAIVAEVWGMEWVQRAAPAHLKVVGMVHESHAACHLAGRHARVLRHFADVDRMLTLTKADADAFARDGLANVEHIPNALHVVPREYAELSAPVVVRLGRLDYDKGQDMLLDAWARLARPDWTLRIYGSGKEEASLHAQTAELGLTASVEWPGATSDIETALCGGSIFALTSREEGFPLAIVEAMAYGLPIVAFDCAPGITELVTDGVDGIVVPAGNTAAFADALRRLMDDEELRRAMGRAARASVQRFAPHLVADRWEELFALLDT